MESSTLQSFRQMLNRYLLADVKKAIRRVCGARVVDIQTKNAVHTYAASISSDHQQLIVDLLDGAPTRRRQRPYPESGPSSERTTMGNPLRGIVNLDAPTLDAITDTPESSGSTTPETQSSTTPPDPSKDGNAMAVDETGPEPPTISTEYLKTVDPSVVNGCVEEFIRRTNNDSMRQGICISCERLLMQSSMETLRVQDIPNRQLLTPAVAHPAHQLTAGMLLAGGTHEPDDEVLLCSECSSRLTNSRRPKFSLANGLWVGPIPPELSGLTLPERILISLTFPAAYVVKLYPSGKRGTGWRHDRLNSGLRGNVSSYKLDQQQISDMVGLTVPTTGQALTVPPPARILSATLAITYIGSNNLPKRCLPGTFRVRRMHVARALQWLKANNPLYANVHISSARLDQLPTNAVPDEVLETVRWSTDVEQLEQEHALYIPLNEDDEDSMEVDDIDQNTPDADRGRAEDMDPGTSEPAVIPLQALGVIDIAGHDIPDAELFAHALANTAACAQGTTSAQGPSRPDYAIRHGGFRSEYARRDPVTGLRFDGGPDNPNHLLGAFPYLFPYGKGGFESDQSENVSYEGHARWAMQYGDRRFRKDLLFVFQVFGVIQKREVCRAATLQIKSMSERVHEQLWSLTAEDLVKASEEEARKVPFSNPAIRALRGQMTAIRARVTGTDESRCSIRGKTWGTNLLFNNPALWLTINPSDTHDPIAQVLAGKEIDLDAFCNTAGPDTEQRAINVANDPFAAAQFFHFTIDLVLEVLFGITGSKGGRRIQRKEGLFGKVQAYIGMVEAQGRGTLHLHLLIWLKDAPSPEVCKQALHDASFRQRLQAFIRQNIHGDIEEKPTQDVFVIPPDKEAGYSRPLDPRSPSVDANRKARTKVLACSLQYHQCRDRVCRVVKKGKLVCKRGAPFSTAKDAWVSHTGQWGPKRYCPYLNAWQPTLLTTLRCNHDLKIITGGAATQNLTWYIANYHAKNQQHSTNISAVLAQRYAYHAVEELRSPNAVDVNKRMLQRCANSLARDREFSAPEVVSYLMGWGDRYESHHYVTIRWDTAMKTLLSAYPGLNAQNEIHQERHSPVDAVGGSDTDQNPSDEDPSFVEPEESYTVQFVGEGLDIRNQVKEYAHWGDSLEHDSFFDVFMETYDAHFKPPSANGPGLTILMQDPQSLNDQGQRRPGRRANERIPY